MVLGALPVRVVTQVVLRVDAQRSLGEKGFSTALRMIIREWQESQLQDPTHMTAEDADRPWSHRTAAAVLKN